MLKDLVHTFGTNVLMVPVGLLTGVIMARHLGPYDRGVLALFLIIPITARAVCMMGLDNASIYLHRKEKVPFGIVFANCVWFSAIVGTLAALVVWLLRSRLPGGIADAAGPLLLISLATIPGELLFHYLGSLARSVGKFGAANTRSVIHKTSLLTAVVLIFLVFDGGVGAYLVSHLIIQAGIVAWLCWDLRRDAKGTFRADFAVLRRMLRYGGPYWATVMAWHAHSRADVYLIAIFLSKPEIAFYGIAAGLAERVFTVTDVVAQVMFPRLASADPKEAGLLAARGSRNVILVALLVVIPLCLFAETVLTLLYGRAYLPAIGPMYILVGGVVVVTMSRVLTQYLLSQNLHHYGAMMTAGAAVLNIALNLVLIPKYGIIGAATSSVVTYSIQGGCALWLFSRLSGLPMRRALIVTRDDLRYLAAVPSRLRSRRPIPGPAPS